MTRRNVLIVSDLNSNFELGNIIHYNVTTAANYEKAIEQLKEKVFDLVITDADVPDVKSCMDLLRWIKSSAKPGEFLPTVFVCHTQKTLRINGKSWIIPRSVGRDLAFPFGLYFEGTIKACIRLQLTPQQKSA